MSEADNALMILSLRDRGEAITADVDEITLQELRSGGLLDNSTITAAGLARAEQIAQSSGGFMPIRSTHKLALPLCR